jgi:hypothetical protein
MLMSTETERAKSFFLAHAKLTSTLFGDEHIKAAESLSRLGMLYFIQGSYPAAELCFAHALDIFVSVSGMKSENVMKAQQNLALVLNAKGDPDGAEHLLNQSLATSCRLSGSQSTQSQVLRQQLMALGTCP